MLKAHDYVVLPLAGFWVKIPREHQGVLHSDDEIFNLFCDGLVDEVGIYESQLEAIQVS